jgi:DNA repair exonuclease SbcCD ATPase subunit
VPVTDLLEIADDLYGLPLGEFTPARDAKAKELKGDDLGKQVKALKKPSTAAWVVNLLVRREQEQVDQVLTVGEALREAQASMSGDELRALTKQRRQLTAALTHQARRLAADEGLKVTQAVADQVEATLTAAMVDEECGKAVRSGLLVAALATTGVDEVELARSVAVPEALGFRAKARGAEPSAPPDLHVVPDPNADAKALAAAQERLDAAEEALAEVQESLDEAVADVEKLEARSMQVQAEIDELKRKLSDLEETYEGIDDELGDAEDTKAEAQDAVRAATKERDAAASAVERLI